MHSPSDFPQYKQKTKKKKKRIWRFVLLVAFQIMQIISVFSFMKISFSKGKNVNFTYQVWLFGLVFTDVNE